MPSEGIILSIRLQVGTLFIVAYFVFIRKGYKDIFPFRQNFFVKIVAKRLIIAKFCGIFNKLYSACMCWCGGMADASDSKSDVGDNMWVQVPPPAPMELSFCGSSIFLTEQ